MRRRITYEKLAQTLQLLQNTAPVDAQTLAKALSVHKNTAAQWLLALHRAKTIYIAQWLPDVLGRDKRPAYRLGSQPDTPRRKLSRAQISQRYRERKKETHDAL